MESPKYMNIDEIIELLVEVRVNLTVFKKSVNYILFSHDGLRLNVLISTLSPLEYHHEPLEKYVNIDHKNHPLLQLH